MKNLAQLPLNTQAKVIRVHDEYLDLMMIAKGIVKGDIVEVSRKTLFGSCMYIRCATHSIAIQTQLAKNIIVEEL